MQQQKSLPYNIVKVLGQGGEGTVHLVQKANSEEKFVMKKRACTDFAAASEALREALTLAQSRSNQFIVSYHDIFLDREVNNGVEIINLCIVMELCEGGDLAMIVQRAVADHKPLAPLLIKRWCSEMARGLKFMHDANTIHRDLKSENIFITGTNSIKIGDFGLAKLLPKHTKTKGIEGTAKCMAPEVYSKEQYDTKADIFSLGCIWWEMGANSILPSHPKPFCVLASEPNYDPVALATPIADPKLRALVALMLAKDPVSRPSVNQILADAYFGGSSAQLLPLAPAITGADIKQLHAAHTDEAVRVLVDALAKDTRLLYALPGKTVPGTIDVDAATYALTQMVKFAFESHGSVWGHVKDNTLQGVAVLRRPYESRIVVTPWKALKFAVTAPVPLQTLKKFLLLEKFLKKNAKTTMGKRPFWHLIQLCVLPAVQNQSIGTQLLSPIVKWADQDKLPIFAEAWNDNAVQFLKKNGFKVVAESKYEGLTFWTTIREPR